MASSQATVENLDSKSSSDGTSGPKGPPPASPKPRSASDSSLFSTVGKSVQDQSQSGLGSEGSSPAIIGMQGLALVQRGIQMLNLSFPENPGLAAVLADLTGRLQMIIPQLVAGSSNGAAAGGGMGLFPQGGMPPGGGAPPQPGMGGPPSPGGMPPPPGAMPPGGQPQPPPMQ